MLRDRLRRHPVAMQAWFERSLVVTWAYPAEVLAPLLPRGLHVHGFGPWAFLACAVVRARRMRPAGLPPWLGLDVTLTGYRVFARCRAAGAARDMVGLRILRSDCDQPLIGRVGNLLTHYGFRPARATLRDDGRSLGVEVRTPDGHGDLDLVADLAGAPAPLPEASPFPRMSIARRFAGPLPFTFDEDAGSGGIVVIEGERSRWEPVPLHVDVRRCAFLDDPRLRGARPVLANAFLVSAVPYRWKRGVVVRPAA